MAGAFPGCRGAGAARLTPGALCIFAATLALAGCDADEPPPLAPEHAAYVGIWENGRFGESDPYAWLQISADGYIAYARYESIGSGYRCLVLNRTPVGGITDTQITVPILWSFTADFVVNRTPYESGGAMHVTVDDDALIRTDSRSTGFDYVWSCDDGNFNRHRVG